jgi:hypothetical protein
MEAVRAYYNGQVFTPEEPVTLAKNTRVIIFFSEDVPEQMEKNSYRITVDEKRTRDAAELEYLNANAERMNAEMVDVLQY